MVQNILERATKQQFKQHTTNPDTTLNLVEHKLFQINESHSFTPHNFYDFMNTRKRSAPKTSVVRSPIFRRQENSLPVEHKAYNSPIP